MKIIIAPAKKMKQDLDSFLVRSEPEFIEEAQTLADFLQSRSTANLKEIWQASDQIVAKSQKQLEQMDLFTRLTPAIVAFSGIQYQYMAPDLFTQPALEYIQENLRIMSGFYGLLRPFDGVTSYRLEMKSSMIGFKDYSLYHFWGEKLAESLFENDDLVINLASKEYSRAIAPYLTNQRKMVTVDFQEQRNGKWRTIATHAKMTRGTMVRYLAENQIKNLVDLQDFHEFGYQFAPSASSEDHYVFRTDFDFKRR